MQRFNYFLSKNSIFWLFSISVTIHLLFVFCSFYFNDDINYSRYAAEVVHHGLSFEPAKNNYQLRWTPIYVTAFFYKLFGINAFASTICSFISVLLCGFILKKAVNSYKSISYFFSLALFFLAHSILFYMHRLLPDAPMCFAVFWLYVSYRAYCIQQSQPIKYALQFAAAFLLSIITKESIVIILPLFFVFFMIDLINRKNRPFWMYASLFSIVLVGIYLLYFKITTGYYFYRYNLLQTNSYMNECSFNLLPWSFTLKRIAYQLWQAMLLNGDLLLLLPALASLIYRKKVKEFENVYNLDFFAFGILLLASNFMTISFTSYVPLCHDPRHFLFLFPFAATISGPMLIAYSKAPSKFLLLPVFIILATLSMFYQHAGATKYLYLLFSSVLLLHVALHFISKNEKLTTLFLLLIFASLFYNYIIDFIRPPYPFYWSHKKVIEKAFLGKNTSATLFVADPNSAEMTEYFMGFNCGNLYIQPIDSAKVNNNGPLYYLIVADLTPKAQAKLDTLKLTGLSSEFTLIDKEKQVSLYKIDDATLHLLK